MPGGPPEQVEIQVDGGTVYGSRTPRWTLAVVARRAALSSLMLMDLRAVLGELEGGAPIRRSTAAAAERGAGRRPRRRRRASRRCPSWGSSREGASARDRSAAPPGSPRAWRPRCGACSASASRACSSTTRPATRGWCSRTGAATSACSDRRAHGRAGRRVRRRGRAARRPRERRMTLVEPALAERVLEQALARGGDFAELYAEARQGFAISLDDGRVERPQGGRERGRLRARGAGRLDLLRARGRPGRGGPAAGGGVGVAGAARRGARAGAPRGGAGPRRATRSRPAPRRSRSSARPTCCAPATSAPRGLGAEVTQVRVGYAEAPPGRGVRLRRAARRPTTARACGSAPRWWRAATAAWRPAATRAAATPAGS